MNNVDFVIFAMWLLLLIRNKAAIVPLVILCCFTVAFNNLNSALVIYCITAATCFVSSIIRCVPDYLRAALLVSGSLYWVGALDEMLYTYLSVTTVYYDVMPYLIITITAYIAAVLFSKGGWQIGHSRRFGRLAYCWRVRL